MRDPQIFPANNVMEPSKKSRLTSPSSKPSKPGRECTPSPQQIRLKTPGSDCFKGENKKSWNNQIYKHPFSSDVDDINQQEPSTSAASPRRISPLQKQDGSKGVINTSRVAKKENRRASTGGKQKSSGCSEAFKTPEKCSANDSHCNPLDSASPTWKKDLLLTVLNKFENHTDQFTSPKKTREILNANDISHADRCELENDSRFTSLCPDGIKKHDQGMRRQSKVSNVSTCISFESPIRRRSTISPAKPFQHRSVSSMVMEVSPPKGPSRNKINPNSCNHADKKIESPITNYPRRSEYRDKKHNASFNDFVLPVEISDFENDFSMTSYSEDSHALFGGEVRSAEGKVERNWTSSTRVVTPSLLMSNVEYSKSPFTLLDESSLHFTHCWDHFDNDFVSCFDTSPKGISDIPVRRCDPNTATSRSLSPVRKVGESKNPVEGIASKAVTSTEFGVNRSQSRMHKQGRSSSPSKNSKRHNLSRNHSTSTIHSACTATTFMSSSTKSFEESPPTNMVTKDKPNHRRKGLSRLEGSLHVSPSNSKSCNFETNISSFRSPSRRNSVKCSRTRSARHVGGEALVSPSNQHRSSRSIVDDPVTKKASRRHSTVRSSSLRNDF